MDRTRIILSFSSCFLKLLLCLVTILPGNVFCHGQTNAIHLSRKMFDVNEVINLSTLSGWWFRNGNDLQWAGGDLDTTLWMRKNPTDFTRSLADDDGKIEGWLRTTVILDSSFVNIPLYFTSGDWPAFDVFVDGRYVCSQSKGGLYNKNSSGAGEFRLERQTCPVSFEPGKEHVIALHLKISLPPVPLRIFTPETALHPIFLLNSTRLMPNWDSFREQTTYYNIFWLTGCGLLTILFSILALENPKEKNLWLIAACTACFFFSVGFNVLERFQTSLTGLTLKAVGFALATVLMVYLILIILVKVFKKSWPPWLWMLTAAVCVLNVYNLTAIDNAFILGLSTVFFMTLGLYYTFSSWRKVVGAQWAIVAGLLITLFWVFLWGLLRLSNFIAVPLHNHPLTLGILTGLYLSFPLSLLVYVSLRFREIIAEVRRKADEVVMVTEEKRLQAVNQQALLEQQVTLRTAQLSETIENLKATQQQLIQSEKMASLGELTAGIAHEIQNPLNFVNNFSEVTRELLAELKVLQKIPDGTGSKKKAEDRDAILEDIDANLEKIVQHGKRADGIVKNMLQHSRLSTGQKEATEINALCEEYLRLAFQGMRSKSKIFNCEVTKDFDQSIQKIQVIPQDMGRVLLNVFNNAFYAVLEKLKTLKPGLPGDYKPVVSVTTKKIGSDVIIKIADNGVGIPDNIKEKIFQPFFTTKPTGQGTGLGLSLAYDIIKAHGGTINLDTREQEGSTFVISIPM